MRKNLQINKRWMYVLLLPVVSFALLSCGGYYYADGICYDPVPERPSYLEIVEELAYTPVENRYTLNRHKDYSDEKAQQYRQMPDTSATHFTGVNSYRPNVASGAPVHGGWGSNPSQVNMNVYNNNPWGYNSWGCNNWHPNYYGYDLYYRNRACQSLSFGWGWDSYYDPYRGYSGHYGYCSCYGGYYDYYSYYGYNLYYGYNPYYGYYSYGGYYPYYGYYYDYRPRDYYYEPSRSYDNGGSYSGRGRTIIRDDNYRSNTNRYEDGRGSYNRSQSQGYYNNNGNYSGRPSYQNQQYNNSSPTGHEIRRAYESNSNYSGRGSNHSNSSSSGGNYSSGSSDSSSSSSGGYRGSDRDQKVLRKMRKISYILFLGFPLAAMGTQTQDYTDILRYSTEELTGVARFRAMSGAFDAPDGDPPAININPTGSAIFNASEVSFSLNNNSQKRDINFLDRNDKKNNNDFNFNRFGVVFAISGVLPTAKKSSSGFNYQPSKTLDNDKFSYLVYDDKGLDDYFLDYATRGNSGNPFSSGTFARGYNLNQQEEIGEYYAISGHREGYAAQMAYLGLKAGLINPKTLSAGNTEYDLSGDNLERLQTYKIERSGYVNKYNFNFASQIGDFIYLGMNLNAYNINEKALYSVKEDNLRNSNPYLRYADHKQYINTTGEGFSLQLGSIIKVTDELCLGVSYQPSTWYKMKGESRQVLCITIGVATTTYDRNIELVNRYGDLMWYEHEYKFHTPSARTTSAAHLIKKRGILSIDYTCRAYDNLKLRSNNIKGYNSALENQMGDTSTLRIGGGYRMPFKSIKEDPKSTNFVSLRVGYRYVQSPYRRTIAAVGDLTGYSFGASVTLGGIRLDTSYDVAKQTNLYQMYENVLTTPVHIKSTYGNLLLTSTA